MYKCVTLLKAELAMYKFVIKLKTTCSQNAR